MRAWRLDQQTSSGRDGGSCFGVADTTELRTFNSSTSSGSIKGKKHHIPRKENPQEEEIGD